ncbi:hypothetical protein [Nocardia sp. NBC_01009]|uniref:hypothetical protein n=1 Tax=Nocardia sp. NBC_01009 TaxID=2975996 RepID=UPI00386C19E7|nr:hypothetical protein OHA42_35755 [Nocardia sp. NBC_01009]
MTTLARRMSQLTGVTAVAAAVLLGTSGVAAADEWPPVPTTPSPTAPFETKHFLTPGDLDYWNPLVSRDRLTSPFGTSTRIVCSAFHGVTLGCWQADRAGNPHKLIRLPFNVPSVTGSSQPGGGPSHFVYPGLS